MRTRLRLLLPLGAIIALSARAGDVPAAANAPEQSTAIVEYVKSPVRSCLVPRLITGRFEDADLVQSQHAWLNKNYPGWTLVRQSLILTLAPEFRPAGGGATDGDEGEHDRLEIVTADGKEISICFSLSLPEGAAAKKE